MRKKRVLLSLLALLLFVCLTSCASNTTSLKESTSEGEDALNPANTETGILPESETVFLIVMSDNTSDQLKDVFKDANEYGVYGSASREVLKDLEKHTLKNPMNNRSLEYSYSECLYKNKSTQAYGTHYSIYDIYKTEDTEIGVLHNAGLICYYYSNQSSEDSVAQLTDAEAKSVADAFILSIVGDDIFVAFDNVSVKADASGVFSHVVNYTRLTNGQRTDENMTVYIDKSGTVVGYNGYNVCKYDTLKEKFDSNKIDSAKVSLTRKINSLGLKNIKMNDPIITTDADGSLYVRIDFSYENEYGYVCGETVLVNVG